MLSVPGTRLANLVGFRELTDDPSTFNLYAGSALPPASYVDGALH